MLVFNVVWRRFFKKEIPASAEPVGTYGDGHFSFTSTCQALLPRRALIAPGFLRISFIVLRPVFSLFRFLIFWG